MLMRIFKNSLKAVNYYMPNFMYGNYLYKPWFWWVFTVALLFLIYMYIGPFYLEINYCAGNSDDVEYFREQLAAAQEAERLHHKSQNGPLSHSEQH